MNIDLLGMFNAAFGGPQIRQASQYLGEAEDNTHAAVRSAAPALLFGLMQRASSPSGAAEIFRTIGSEGIDPGIGSKLSEMFVNRGTMGSLLNAGENLSGTLLGSRTGALSNALAETSGVRPNSAMAVLSLCAPLLLGIVRKLVTNNDLDASALASVIARQKGSLENSGLNDRIAGALGFGNVRQLLASLSGGVTTATAVKTQPRDKAWMPWAIAAGIAIFGVLFFVNRTADHQEAPGGAVQIAEVPDDTDRVRVATADSAQVYFRSGDSNIDQEDRERIAGVAQSARVSERPVAITGYTDQAGDQSQNEELAKSRALAVRQALVSEGVQEDQIVMDPPRTATGTGTDDEAHRVDIDMR